MPGDGPGADAAPAGSSRLPATGASPMTTAAIAVVLVALGLGLLATAARARAHRAPPARR